LKLSNLAERIDRLIKLSTEGEQSSANAYELVHGTLSVLTAAHGPESPQAQAFQNAVAITVKKGIDSGGDVFLVRHAAVGALRDLKQNLELGILGTLQATVTGDVLTDHVALARAVFSETGDGAKNVSAVLAAAAFEDTLRRLAALKDLPHYEKLADTLTALKENGHLAGAQVGIANSYLKFRNDALHARWENIDRPSVSSALGFVEELLLKHFS
jgi:hypothetical protein